MGKNADKRSNPATTAVAGFFQTATMTPVITGYMVKGTFIAAWEWVKRWGLPCNSSPSPCIADGGGMHTLDSNPAQCGMCKRVIAPEETQREVAVSTKRNEVTIRTLVVNKQRQMTGAVLSNGDELVGIVGGGLQLNGGRIEGTSQVVDMLELGLVGSFKVDHPDDMDEPSLLFSANGKKL